MKRVLTQIVFALIAIGFSHFGSVAKACVCNAHVSPYREYTEARAVFAGKVMGSRDVAATEQIRDQTYTAYERLFQFAVDESLKGSRHRELK